MHSNRYEVNDMFQCHNCSSIFTHPRIVSRNGFGEDRKVCPVCDSGYIDDIEKQEKYEKTVLDMAENLF